MILLERNLRLEEKHRRLAEDSSFDTMLEKMVVTLWYYFRPCRVTIDSRGADDNPANLWRDLDLSIGDRITIRVEID